MNKTSFFQFLALLLSLIITSCAGENNQKRATTSDSLSTSLQQDSVAEIDRNAEGQNNTGYTYLDTTVRVDGDYTITCISYNIDGEDEDVTCTVKNTKTGFVKDSLGYVSMIKGGYIFCESDDEVMNNGILTLIKMEDEREIHTFYFIDNYELDKDKLKIFEIINDQEYLNKSKLPPIPEELKDKSHVSYAEQKIFYFKTEEIKNTGNFKCFYQQ